MAISGAPAHAVAAMSSQRISVVKSDGTLRMTTIDKVLSNVDDESQNINAGVLFELFDVDSSGQISYDEYQRLHEGLIRLVRMEHANEAKLAFDVASAQQSEHVALQKGKRANRRSKLAGCMSLVLLVFLLISSGLNVASQLYIGELQASAAAHHTRLREHHPYTKHAACTRTCASLICIAPAFRSSLTFAEGHGHRPHWAHDRQVDWPNRLDGDG